MKTDAERIPQHTIQCGEIISYRAWRWIVQNKKDDRYCYYIINPKKYNGPGLYSFSEDYKWSPQNIEKVDKSDFGYFEGLYSFKHPLRTWIECASFLDGTYIVLGSIYSWGKIIEHKKGYRSQYAKIRSIDWVQSKKFNYYNALKLRTQIREMYGV